jgi:glutamate/tyrosine decarboxylase-like PLP-dependent enzyme
MRAALAAPLTDAGVAADRVISELVAAAEPGLGANAGPRWFGFVDGGTLPVALAADWLTSGWDQNAGLAIASPAAAMAEEVVTGWILELLGLPATASAGFVTGGQMANFTCLAAARDQLLRRARHDVAKRGLRGAPPLRVIAGEQAHATIHAALRMLGIGADAVERIAADDQGRADAGGIAVALARSRGPAIVCLSAGNVNTGAFDPFDEAADAAREHGAAWIHVDGAFGLWAAAAPSRRHLLAGADRADSWTVDAHKWLNVPYDSGIAIVRDPDAHRAATAVAGPYLIASRDGRGDGTLYVPEASRRARGFVLYATLRALGRDGVAAIVECCCEHARRFAELLAVDPGVEILGDVVLNQVLVGFPAATPEAADARVAAVVAAVQSQGTCWVGGTSWRGRAAMRISVVGAATTAADVDRSAAAILAAAAPR